MDHQLLLCFNSRIDGGAVIFLKLHPDPPHLEEIPRVRLIQLDGVGDLEVRTAVSDLDAGGVRAGLGSGDAAALGDRLLGVEVDRVDDIPLLDGAPQVASSVPLPPVRRAPTARAASTAQQASRSASAPLSAVRSSRGREPLRGYDPPPAVCPSSERPTARAAEQASSSAPPAFARRPLGLGPSRSAHRPPSA